MKVKALKVGYYNHRRIKQDEIFDMDDEHFSPVDADGKPMHYAKGSPKAGQVMQCSWVEPIEGPVIKSEKTGNKRKKSDLNEDVI